MEKKLEPKSSINNNGNGELTYDQLKSVCRQLSGQVNALNDQNNRLKGMINEANLANLYKRLDYLFKVIGDEKDNPFLSDDFKNKCGKEIEFLMASPNDEEDTKEDTKEDNKEEK